MTVAATIIIVALWSVAGYAIGHLTPAVLRAFRATTKHMRGAE